MSSVATADIHRAINTVWDASTLDALFKALWTDPAVADFEVLNDQDAAPEQPFPYCVLDETSSAVVTRMSAPGAFKREVRDVDVRFNVHARAVDGDARTAKEIAAALAEEIMKQFGGHPTEHPAALELENGSALITQYVNDFGVRTGDDEYQWVVVYNVRVDVPVAVQETE